MEKKVKRSSKCARSRYSRNETKKSTIRWSKLQNEVTKQSFNEILSSSSIDSYTKLCTSIQLAAECTLTVEERERPDWFTSNQITIMQCIEQHDIAQKKYNNDNSSDNLKLLRKSRTNLKRTLDSSKESWIRKLCKRIENTPNPFNMWQATKTQLNLWFPVILRGLLLSPSRRV